MNNELLEVIKKSLPEQTVGVLKEELEELSRLRDIENKYNNLEDEYKKHIEEFDCIKSELKVYKDLDTELYKREKEITKRELEYKSVIAMERQQNAEDKVLLMKDLLGQIFKSPVYRKEISNERSRGEKGETMAPNLITEIVE